MNKIIIRNNKVDHISFHGVQISHDDIIFQNSGEFVIEYVDCDNICFNISVMDDAHVTLYVFSRDNDLKVSNHYTLNHKSCLTLYQFYDDFGVYEDSVVDLNGEFSKFYQGFSSISRGVLEYHIIVNHNTKNVSSDVRNKCIGLDGSKITLQIDSNLKKGNIDCVMDQVSRILTLGDVEAKIIPNMFIDEDSVQAKHGSIIGSFSEDEVFYFMSRGISRDEAIMLLIKGFLFSNVVANIFIREFIMNSILNMRR